MLRRTAKQKEEWGHEQVGYSTSLLKNWIFRALYTFVNTL